MKNSILTLAIFLSFVSCKKSDPTNEFVATDLTGTMVLRGNLSKNTIIPGGNANWVNNGKTPAANIGVVVKVNRNELYPNSTAQGADMYYGKSDSLGNYVVTVRTNATGVNAEITFDGFNSTLDTIINNQTKKGAYATFAGTNLNRNLVMSQNMQLDYMYNGTPLISNTNNNLKSGTAIVTGFVYVNTLKQVLTGTLVTLTTTNVGLANTKVYLNLSNDPITFNTKSYETTTDGNGAYTFTINTVESGNTGFNQNASIWVNDFAATRDTVKANNTITTGKAGVFQKVTNNQNGLYNHTIRNAVNLTYNAFVPN